MTFRYLVFRKFSGSRIQCLKITKKVSFYKYARMQSNEKIQNFNKNARTELRLSRKSWNGDALIFAIYAPNKNQLLPKL